MNKLILFGLCILFLGLSVEVSALCLNPLEFFCLFEEETPIEEPKGFIGYSGTSIEWNIEKTGAEENLDVDYDILNDTATKFCIGFEDRIKYKDKLIEKGKDIKKVPLEKINKKDKFNVKKTKLDLSETTEECFIVSYDEMIEGMEFKIGWDSVLIGTGWSPSLYYPRNEKMVKDSNGILHLLWIDSSEDLYYSNSTDSGETWTTKLLHDTEAEMVNLLINSSDGLWGVWMDATPTTGYDVYYSDSSDYGVTWSSPSIIPSFEGNLTHRFESISAVMDDNDNIHICVLIGEWDDDSNQELLVYSNYTNSWLSEFEWVNQNSTDDSDSCDIETDSDGTVYIVAAGSDEDDVDLWTSTGTGWGSDNEYVIHAGTSDSHPSIFIDQNDKIVVVWEEGIEDLNFANSTPSSATSNWDVVEVDSLSSHFPDVKITDYGDIYILYHDYTASNRDVLQAFWNISTGTWTARTILKNDTWSSSPYPSMRGSRIGSDTITDRIDYMYWNDTDDGVYFDYFSVTAPIVDTSPPSFSAITDNSSATLYNGTTVQINITLTDTTNVDFYTLTTNDSSGFTWTNETLIDVEATTVNVIWNYSIEWFPATGGTLGVRFWANDTGGYSNVSNIHTITIQAEMISPTISNIESNTPQGYGYNISINATVTDTSNVNATLVQIKFPNGTFVNFTMTEITTDIYNYNLEDTWQLGSHNYTIFANDSLGNMGNSSVYEFNISISANISIKTINDRYGINQQVNLTDPPPEKMTLENNEEIVGQESINNELLIKEQSIKTFEENQEEEIPIIIEFEQEPLLPYNKIADEESETSLLTKTLDIFISEETAKNFVKIRKIKSHTKEIETTHKNTIKTLKINKAKREWKDLMNGIAITIKRNDFDKIKNLPNVKNVWKDENLTILLDDSIPLINVDDVWRKLDSQGRNITGVGIKVAIIDTGIAYNHSAFESSCDTTAFTSGLCNKTVYGYDFYNEDTDPYDDHGHGTHCAGIVASENDTYKGVAPNVTLLAYKVCSSWGSCPSSDIISGIENATLYGADVISISLGGTGYADNVYTTVIDNAVNNGTVVVIAAGNSGSRFYTIGSPGTTLSSITVGSSDKSDSIASSSSRGFSMYSNGTIAGIKPDVVAPGVSITSTVPIGSCTHCTSSGYKSLSGTSMAAPHVAGAIALLKQQHPNWTVSQFKSAISNPAISIGENPNTQGAGRIDALTSYNLTSLIIPNNLYFGLNKEDNTKIWNGSFQLNLTNLNKSLTYNLTVDVPQSGINVTLNITNINLTINESIIIGLNVTINNSIISDNGEYYGNITIISNESQVTKIPYAGFLIINPPDCITDDYYINHNTNLSKVDCDVVDLNGNGVFIINASDIILDCNHSTYDGLNRNYGSAFVESGSRGISSSNKSLENITIKNCNIIGYKNGIFLNFQKATIENNNLSNNMANALDIEDNTYNHTIRNNSFIDNWNGIYMTQRTGGNKVFNNYISSSVSSSIGLYVMNTINSNFSNNVIDGVKWEAIRIEKDVQKNIFINNTLKDSSVGILLWYGDVENNTFLDNNISGNSKGIQISGANNNNLTRLDITGGTYSFFVDKNGGSNNIIFDSTFEKKIFAQASDSINYLINTTFPSAILYGASSIVTQWYLTVNISNSTVPLQNVNITVYENSTGTWTRLWSELTDSNGLVLKKPTTQYLENSTARTYYTLNVTATKDLYYTNYTIIENLTTNSQLNMTLGLTAEGDVTSPIITIISPTDNSIHNITWVMLNITTNEACINATYSLNGTANVTMNKTSTTSFYYNLTNLADNSTYNITFWVNDTSGNWGQSDLIYFEINTSYEVAEEVTKSMINSTGTTNFKGYLTLKVQKNISGTWTDYKIVTDNILIDVNTSAPFALDTQWYSNGSYTTNSTGTFQVYAELKSKNGSLLIDDSGKYFNVSYEFTVTGEDVPTVTIISPNTSTYFNVNHTLLNYTVTDDVDTSLTCWYNLNGTINVSPNNPIANGTYDAINLTNLTDGSYTINVICQDSIPQNGTSTTNTFYIDSIKPKMYNPDPASGEYVEGSSAETFIISVNDETAIDTDSGIFWWRFPEGEFYANESMTCSVSSCNYDLDMSALEEGDVLSFYFEIEDEAGNLGYNGTFINPLTVTKDSNSPSWSGNQTNASLAYYNYNYQFNITVSDEVSLEYWSFSWNGTTGNWDNLSNGTLSGTSQKLIINKTIGLTAGNTIGYRWYANDSAGYWNTSLLRIFIVQDITNPNSNISSNNTSPKINQVVNISMNVSDNLELSSCLFYNNMSDTNSSAISLSGTSDHNLCFNVTTINVTQGNHVLFRGYVNDASNNWNWSDIIITIANTAPNQPTISFPIDGKNYSDTELDINFTATDADSDSLTYTLYINNTINVTDTSTNVTDWNASDGFYNLTVTANDGTDSSVNSTVVHFRLDTIAPSWSGNETNASLMKINGNATFNITISDYGSGLSFYIFSWNGTGIWDNNTNGTISGSSQKLIVNKSTNLSQGNTVGYRWYANDSLNQWNESLLRIFTVIDTLPTVPTSDSLTPNNPVITNELTGSCTGSNDADSDTITYHYRFYDITDSNERQAFSSDTTYQLVSPTDSHDQFRVDCRATTPLGNSPDRTGTDLETVQNTAPNIPSVTSPFDTEINNEISIEFNSSDIDGDSISYTIYINNTLNGTTTVNISSWNGADGYYNLTITANDSTDYSVNSTVVHFTLDTSSPAFSNNKTNASSTTYNGTDVQFNLTISDGRGIDFYRLATIDSVGFTWTNKSLIDAGDSVSVTPVFNHTIENFPLVGGTFSWRVWANDTLGNVNQSNIYTFLVANSTSPPTPDNYLDFYDMWVDELVGDIWLFVFLGLIMIWFLAIKGKLTTEVSMLFIILFLAAIFAKTGLTILWVFSVLGTGLIFYYKLSKIIRQG